MQTNTYNFFSHFSLCFPFLQPSPQKKFYMNLPFIIRSRFLFASTSFFSIHLPNCLSMFCCLTYWPCFLSFVCHQLVFFFPSIALFHLFYLTPTYASPFNLRFSSPPPPNVLFLSFVLHFFLSWKPLFWLPDAPSCCLDDYVCRVGFVLSISQT